MARWDQHASVRSGGRCLPLILSRMWPHTAAYQRHVEPLSRRQEHQWGRSLNAEPNFALIGKLALWFTEISTWTWDVMTHLRLAASVVWTSVCVPFSTQLAGVQKAQAYESLRHHLMPRLCARDLIRVWRLWTSLGSAGFTGCNNLFRITFKVANLLSCFQSVFGQLTSS